MGALSYGPGFTLAGAGLALGAWTAERAGLKLSAGLLIPVGVVAAFLFFGGLALILRGHLASRRKMPSGFKDEIATIQRELVRHENRRQGNGGSIWPIERPYRDLPTNQWMAYATGLRLSDPDKEAVANAYEMARRFNDEMLAGEMTIASANEPDLAALRRAFDRAAVAVGLPPALTPNPPTSPGEFGRRDDGGELAQRCHMLAGSVERWVEKFNRGHSERVERMVAEWLEADPTTDSAEARRMAYTRDEKNWEADYRLKYEIEAKKLFDEAYERGEIAKEHEQLAIAPLAIQFEAVPRLFNEIAASLYGETPE